MSVEFFTLRTAFTAELRDPKIDLCELLGVVEEFRTQLHDMLGSTNAPTVIDHGGPITLRSEELD